MSHDDLARKFNALQERLDALAETPEPEPPAEPIDAEERFAQELASRLSQAQSTWYSTDG